MAISDRGTSILSAAATGAGIGVKSGGSGNYAIHTIFTGTVTALTIALEGSLDGGTTWGVLGSDAFVAGDITAKNALFYVTNSPTKLVRANITAYTGTGTAVVWFSEAN